MRLLRLWRLCVACAVCALGTGSAPAQASRDYLANNVVLIVRHAEKPASGRALTPQGEARARAYVSYFEPFHDGAFSFRIDGLYAGADSAGSMRPRLTLEPLHAATGMVLHTDVGTNESPLLVRELRNEPHGPHPLVSWRHSQIPALLQAFGASPTTLLPNGKWPDEVFDWVIVLTFDTNGKLSNQRLVHEDLKVATP